MNEQDTTHPGSEVAPTSEHGTAVRLDQGHVVGDGGLPERFTNPGLPDARRADGRPRRGRRPPGREAGRHPLRHLDHRHPGLHRLSTSRSASRPRSSCRASARPAPSNFALGVTLALGLLGIGFGAVHWAKTLTPDEEVVEERHPLRATDESRDRVVEELTVGGGSRRSPGAR